MALIFVDSFGYYNDIASKWTPGAIGVIDLSGTLSRTGLGCMLIPAGVFGPYRAFPRVSEIIVGGAFYPDNLAGYVWWLANIADAGISVEDVQIAVQSDGSVAWLRGGPGGPQLQGASAPNVCVLNSYNYIEAYVKFSTTNTGIVTIRVNGAQVFHVSGVRTNGQFVPTPFCDAVRLMGCGGASAARHDDFYVLNPLVAPNNTFLGPVRIFAALPFADSAPLDWTPSVGVPHFPLVNSIPPDLSKWVQSNTVGQKDQYQHDVSAIPSTVNVLGVQHAMLMGLDAPGARVVASCVDGIDATASAAALSTSPAQYMTVYDVDPVTGLPWSLADLSASRVFGPAVTA